MQPNSAGMYDFAAIGEVADTTKQLIALNLQYNLQSTEAHSTGLEAVERIVLQQAREYLANVREGFVLSVRAGQVTSKSELAYLIDRVVLDWNDLSEELGLGPQESEPPSESSGEAGALSSKDLQRIRTQLLAFGMAIIALGELPRLPAELITFPRSYSDPPTYSDIPVPVTPGEILDRIEELEQMIWRFTSRNWDELARSRYGPLRRTYGFFETSALLALKECQRFGIKKSRRNLL